MAENPVIKINTFGGLEILDRSSLPVSPGTRKAMALLVYLAFTEGRPQSRPHLASLMWGRSAEQQARSSLRQTLSSIRKSLESHEGILITKNETVALDPQAIWLDAIELEKSAKDSSLSSLEKCAQLYRGEFLAGFSLASVDFDSWQLSQQQHLSELAIRAFTSLLQHHETNQAYDQCIDIGQRILTINPLQEKAHQSLMRCFALSGRRETAIKQFIEFEKLLKRELDIEPEHPTRELYRGIVENKPFKNSEITQKPEAEVSLQPQSKDPGSRATTKNGGKPSIAVLPFENLSGNSSQNYFSDGITDDIIIALTRFRALTVIARSSSFSFRNKNMTIASIAAELGVDYIVEGSIRRAGSQIRISANLVVAKTGEQVWGNQYDRELKDIFEVQDEVTGNIVATLGGRLDEHRAIIGHRSSSDDWSVYDLILRAQEQHYRINKAANLDAQRILHQARLLDSENARVYSLLGAVQLLDYVMHWTTDPEESLRSAMENGRASVKLDNSDSLAHARLGETLIHHGLNSESEMHFHKAMNLNPNDSEAIALYSTYLLATGKPDLAIKELDKVRKMDPFERVWIPWLRGEALFHNNQFNEAISAFEEVTEPINDLKSTLAACYARIGDITAAKNILQQYLLVAREEMPDYPGEDFEDWKPVWKSSSPYRDNHQYQFLLDSLSLAWPT